MKADHIYIEVPIYYKVCDQGHVTIMEEASISMFKDAMQINLKHLQRIERKSVDVKDTIMSNQG